MLESRPRLAKMLANELAERLNGYATVARAAGIGLFALTLPASASAVFTPAHVTIKPNSVFDLDVDGDGTADFRFRDLSNFNGGFLSVNGRQASNSVLVHPQHEAAALSLGSKIGSSGYFFNCRNCRMFGAVMLNVTANITYGNWGDVFNRYLGLKFLINGQIHYGWARLSVTFLPGKSVTARLTGYAYETVADQAILAGQTTSDSAKQMSNHEATPVQSVGGENDGTLGHLARGAAWPPERWRISQEE